MSVKRTFHAVVAVGLGTLLAGSVAAAGMVVGKVTAVDPSRDTITINGIKFELSDAARRELLSRFNEVKPGLAVTFEANGNQLLRIRPVQGGVDFPVLAPPGPAASPGAPGR